jgi:uncharacterized protein (DUF1800 family)
MELFALGVGNYTEDDVREAARAFTGWQVPRVRLEPNVFQLQPAVFRPQRFDSGTKTFLGRSGNFRPDDIVQIISEQPAIGPYITGRLFSFFVHPDPSDEELAPFVDVYRRNEGRIGAVLEAMLRSEVFYSPQAYRAIVKSPLEYAIGALKALGLQDRIGQALIAGAGGPRRGGGVLGDMGQVPFEPPNVAGWPGGGAWLNSATIFARLNFLNAITSGEVSSQTPARRFAGQQPGVRPNGPRAQQQARTQPSAGPDLELGTAGQALDYFLPLVLDDNLPDDAREVLLDYAGGADANISPAQLRGLVYLVLGAPQFHLA